jgi:hypothetical protein
MPDATQTAHAALYELIASVPAAEGNVECIAAVARRIRTLWQAAPGSLAPTLSEPIRNTLDDIARNNNTTSLFHLATRLAELWTEWSAAGATPDAPRTAKRINYGAIPNMRPQLRAQPTSPRCEGGELTRCHHRATWRARTDTTDIEPPAWTYACGVHLAREASDLTGGEQGRLVVERIVTDER